MSGFILYDSSIFLRADILIAVFINIEYRDFGLRGCLKSLICYITRPRASPNFGGLLPANGFFFPPELACSGGKI